MKVSDLSVLDKQSSGWSVKQTGGSDWFAKGVRDRSIVCLITKARIDLLIKSFASLLFR